MMTSDDLAFFTVLAGSKSLAEAPRKLNVTPPAVSQLLRAVEARAGVRLIDRTGRQSRLTDEGTLVAAHGRVVAETIDALAEALGDRTNRVIGHLRVVAPYGFGGLHVAPVIDAFVREHDRVKITLELSDRPGAQLIESCDIAIHIGLMGPLKQVTKTLAPNRRFLCASPAYLEQNPSIETPGDLARHRCLVVRENNEDVTLWRFSRSGLAPTTIRVHPAMSSNDGTVIRDWAVRGFGIVLRSEWNVASDIAQGRLRVVLPKWELPSADVVAMLGSPDVRSARTSAFLAMIKRALNPAPWRQKTR